MYRPQSLRKKTKKKVMMSLCSFIYDAIYRPLFVLQIISLSFTLNLKKLYHASKSQCNSDTIVATNCGNEMLSDFEYLNCFRELLLL